MPPQPYYFDTRQKFIQFYMNETLYRLICQSQKNFRGITVVCIGSDRLIGDSYGPLTGHMLSGLRLPDVSLYGTLDNPVHALSLKSVMKGIDEEKTLVIAIDSSVGHEDNIGYVSFTPGSIRPGSGLGKKLPAVGDISITGIVAAGNTPFINLQNTSLGLVYGMAEKTYLALRYAITKKAQTAGRIFTKQY